MLRIPRFYFPSLPSFMQVKVSRQLCRCKPGVNPRLSDGKANEPVVVDISNDNPSSPPEKPKVKPPSIAQAQQAQAKTERSETRASESESSKNMKPKPRPMLAREAREAAGREKKKQKHEEKHKAEKLRAERLKAEKAKAKRLRDEKTRAEKLMAERRMREKIKADKLEAKREMERKIRRTRLRANERKGRKLIAQDERAAQWRNVTYRQELLRTAKKGLGHKVEDQRIRDQESRLVTQYILLKDINELKNQMAENSARKVYEESRKVNEEIAKLIREEKKRKEKARAQAEAQLQAVKIKEAKMQVMRERLGRYIPYIRELKDWLRNAMAEQDMIAMEEARNDTTPGPKPPPTRKSCLRTPVVTQPKVKRSEVSELSKQHEKLGDWRPIEAPPRTLLAKPKPSNWQPKPISPTTFQVEVKRPEVTPSPVVKDRVFQSEAKPPPASRQKSVINFIQWLRALDKLGRREGAKPSGKKQPEVTPGQAQKSESKQSEVKQPEVKPTPEQQVAVNQTYARPTPVNPLKMNNMIKRTEDDEDMAEEEEHNPILRKLGNLMLNYKAKMVKQKAKDERRVMSNGFGWPIAIFDKDLEKKQLKQIEDIQKASRKRKAQGKGKKGAKAHHDTHSVVKQLEKGSRAEIQRLLKAEEEKKAQEQRARKALEEKVRKAKEERARLAQEEKARLAQEEQQRSKDAIDKEKSTPTPTPQLQRVGVEIQVDPTVVVNHPATSTPPPPPPPAKPEPTPTPFPNRGPEENYFTDPRIFWEEFVDTNRKKDKAKDGPKTSKSGGLIRLVDEKQPWRDPWIPEKKNKDKVVDIMRDEVHGDRDQYEESTKIHAVKDGKSSRIQSPPDNDIDTLNGKTHSLHKRYRNERAGKDKPHVPYGPGELVEDFVRPHDQKADKPTMERCLDNCQTRCATVHCSGRCGNAHLRCRDACWHACEPRCVSKVCTARLWSDKKPWDCLKDVKRLRDEALKKEKEREEKKIQAELKEIARVKAGGKKRPRPSTRVVVSPVKPTLDSTLVKEGASN